MDKTKLIKMFAVLTAIVVLVALFSQAAQKNSMTLTEHEELLSQSQQQTASSENADAASDAGETTAPSVSPAPSSSPAEVSRNDENAEAANTASQLIGASLNAASLEDRITLKDGFYYEPVSDNLRRYITGISYPAPSDDAEPEITVEELRYVHILHYDFDGEPAEGELICNQAIAQDLVEIFYELYRNQYQLERVRLIDEYEGDDDASMDDNNTSCFNYRVVEGTTTLSKHAFGLAVDVNPYYNPYITYAKNGDRSIFPPDAEIYADRSADFPYKIDEDDLCYKLFTEHGFIWGGNWNNSKDYQHFQKNPD